MQYCAETGEHGLDLEPTAEDEDVAAKLAVSYADDPEKDFPQGHREEGGEAHTRFYGSDKQHIARVRTFHCRKRNSDPALVTNKLLLESENDDPRIRIRALELLGKISDVGLFAEKSRVTLNAPVHGRST